MGDRIAELEAEVERLKELMRKASPYVNYFTAISGKHARKAIDPETERLQNEIAEAVQ